MNVNIVQECLVDMPKSHFSIHAREFVRVPEHDFESSQSQANDCPADRRNLFQRIMDAQEAQQAMLVSIQTMLNNMDSKHETTHKHTKQAYAICSKNVEKWQLYKHSLQNIYL